MGAIPKPVVATAQSSIAPFPPKPSIELSLDAGVFKTETPFITADQLAANQKRSADIAAQEAAVAAAEALAAQQAAEEAARLQAAQNMSYANASYANMYDFGNCTYWVASRRSVPSNWGNAGQWLWHAQSLGYATSSTPRAGAIGWTGAGYYGHVVYVERVDANGAWISEMNAVGFDQVDYRYAYAGEFTYIL